MSEIKTETKDLCLEKLYKDLKQNKYNLKKRNLYQGLIKKHLEALLNILKNDFEL